MESAELIKLINEELAIELPGRIPLDEVREKLSIQINYLIESDFQRLVSMLYRIDVSENKLKNLLAENPGEDAGRIIAELIIERQLQKIKSRSAFKQRDENIDENEKW